MVDDIHPTTQFHPYQPPTATPQSEIRKAGALDGVWSRLGVDPERIHGRIESLSPDMHRRLDNVRSWARNNGALALGGLAATVVGAGLLARRIQRHRISGSL